MIDIIKTELRISHSKADATIQNMIASALADLRRMGASPAVVVDSNPLVVRAVSVYCRREFTDDMSKRDRYNLAYEQMADELRKSGDSYLSGLDNADSGGAGAG